MQGSENEFTIKVGFGSKFEEITVRIPDGDIPPYQPGDELDVIGQSENRLDAAAKVTGRARYTYDQKPPGMLYGKILRSPHPNASIKSVDLSAALALPGVQGAISFTDAFQKSSVRFAWDGVAAVAALTEAGAEEALRAIRVEYDVLPFSVTRADSLRPDAVKVGRGSQANVERIYPRISRFRDGRIDEEAEAETQVAMKQAAEDIDRLLGSADVVVKETFETQVQTHAPLETHGGVCWWEAGKLVCLASTQATFNVRRELSHPRGAVQAESAQVICEHVGGGFGSKFSAGEEIAAAALLAKQTGAPVKIMLDRREEHTSTGNRPDSRQELAMGVHRDGRIVAYRVRGWGTAGTGTRGAGAHNDAIYKFGENPEDQDDPRGMVDKVEYGVRTNCGNARPLRAPGWPQGVFALEGLMDMAAEAIGMDPLEFRKRNDFHPIRIAEYDIARHRSGWDLKFKRGASAQKGHLKTGIGCASTLWHARGGGGASVLVRIHKTGRVEVRNGAQDIGTGTRTIMGMVAAEELGIPLASVATFIGNTEDPRGPASGGSTTAPTITPAARLAAHRAKRQLLGIVAEAQGWQADDLDLKRGFVVNRDGRDLGRRITFKQACALMDEDQIEVLQDRPIFDRRRPNYEGLADENSGVQIAEVEVDTETGEVRVRKVVAVQNAGKIINPKLARSQVRGGVIQGVSYALFERRVMDRAKGHMLNADLESYKIAGPMDCPEIDVALLDVYMGHNNTNVMGIGEPPVVATAAAVANAVYNAIGARVTSLPITPKKVLEALHEKEARG